MSFSIQILKTGGLVVLTGGTIIASIIGGNWLADNISKRLYKDDDTKENEIDEPKEPDEPYEYKFIDEYQKKYKDEAVRRHFPIEFICGMCNIDLLKLVKSTNQSIVYHYL